MASRRHGRGLQPADANCSIERLLADAQQPRGLARADQPEASTIKFETPSELVGVLGKEAAVAARSDDGGLQPSLCDRAENGRPADAKAGCQIVRTDQCVQNVCWSNALLAGRDHSSTPEPCLSPSGAAVSSLKMYREQPTRSRIPRLRFLMSACIRGHHGELNRGIIIT